jgi:GT2 family glycosyltransferase
MMRLHVIVVSFNAKELVLRCIDSLLACDQALHVHISDNGSLDGTLEAINERYADLSTVTLYQNAENLGFARACNVPLSSLEAEYILFLNPDACIPEKSLSKMLVFMDKNPTVGMAGPLIVNEDGTEQRGCRRREPTPGRVLATFFPFKGLGASVNMLEEESPCDPVDIDAISGAFMLVRGRALRDVGRMDEGYFLHCEDLDWCKRFWLKGWKVRFVPDVVVTHFKGGSSRSRPIRVEWHKHKGMVRYYHKFYKSEYSMPVMWLVYTAVWTRFLMRVPALTLMRWIK